MPYDATWTLTNWKIEVAEGKTELGYYSWVAHRKSRSNKD